MRNAILIACLMGSTFVRAGAASSTEQPQPQGTFLGEICFDLHSTRADIASSILRLAVSKTGSSWPVNGRWVVMFAGSNLNPPGQSMAVSGVVARDAIDGNLDMSVSGFNFVDDGGVDLRLHAKMNSAGVGTWIRRIGFDFGGFETGSISLLVPCPADSSSSPESSR